MILNAQHLREKSVILKIHIIIVSDMCHAILRKKVMIAIHIKTNFSSVQQIVQQVKQIHIDLSNRFPVIVK